MRRAVCRLLSLALSLVMVLSIAVTASAGETKWTGIDGYYYTGRTTKSDTEYVISVPIDDASVVAHETGKNEVITWPTGYCVNYKATYTASVRPYAEQLNIAIKGDGLVNEITSEAPVKDFYELDPTLPEKTYSYGTEITVCDVTCTILRTQEVQIQTCAVSLPYATGKLEKAVVGMTACKLIVVSD